MQQPDYNLFVLGDVGSGRASLMRQAMQDAAASRPVPPDLCYLHDFDRPERPRPLRLPAGQGRALREGTQEWVQTLLSDIPKRLSAADVKAESEKSPKPSKAKKPAPSPPWAALPRHATFAWRATVNKWSSPCWGPAAAPSRKRKRNTSPAQRHSIEQAEQELRAEIVRFLERTRPLERKRDEALEQLYRQAAKPLVDHALNPIRQSLRKHIKDTVTLHQWLEQVQREVLDNLDLFLPQEGAGNEAELQRQADLKTCWHCAR